MTDNSGIEGTAIEIADQRIGPGNPCFIIAELGVNHNGDVGKARDLIHAAAATGASAVKIQSFVVENLVTEEAPTALYQRSGGWGELQAEMLRKLSLDREAHMTLAAEASKAGVIFLSSAFDEQSLDLLISLDVPAIKIPSGELTNHLYLRHAASLARPLLISTGMATMQEVDNALAVISEVGQVPLALFHCVSAYPAPAHDANLRAMAALRSRFGVPVGFSDHTQGVEIAIAAVALGADMLEKHLTLDSNDNGPDHRCSLEPSSFRYMVESIRAVESAVGDGVKAPRSSEADTAIAARKSLVVLRDLPLGHTIATGDVGALRPGTGIPPSELPRIIGRRTRHSLSAGSILSLDALE